jgi:hypothetical protein
VSQRILEEVREGMLEPKAIGLEQPRLAGDLDRSSVAADALAKT